jgi:hypothetical protein
MTAATTATTVAVANRGSSHRERADACGRVVMLV